MVIVLIIHVFLMRVYRFSPSTTAMIPPLKAGEILIVNRCAYFVCSPQRNDIIAFFAPGSLHTNTAVAVFQKYIYGGRPRLSRIIGVPGDCINGYKLKANEFWLKNDNPGGIDSNDFGPISYDLILGKVSN